MTIILEEEMMRIARTLRTALALLLACAAGAASAQPAEKLVFLTNWYAEAEHGGFYQALATGLYRKHGLDVTIKMGGPQVNGLQLLLAGQADLFMGYDIQTINAVERGLPVVTIAAAFQKDPTVIVAHPGVEKLEMLKGRPVAISSASNTTFWPWLRTRYGFDDGQIRPYSFSVQPFLADKNLAQQGYATSEPFMVAKAGVKPNVFLLADFGYPPYAETVIVTRDTLAKRRAALKRFVEATAQGWKAYFADPAPAHALIKKDNPQMADDLLAFGVKTMTEYGIVAGGDAVKLGIMTMTDVRWKRTFEFMAQAGLVRRDVDYTKAYTLELVKDVKVLP